MGSVLILDVIRLDIEANRMFPATFLFQVFEISHAALRRNVLSNGIGVITEAVAITALMVFALRKPRSDRTLLWFGIFGALYGVRILAGSSVFCAPFGISERAANNAVLFINYTIQIPAALFALALIDAVKSRLGAVILGMAGLLAVVGTFSVLTGLLSAYMPRVNSFLVLVFFLPTYIWLYSRRTPDGIGLRWMKVSFVIFLASVVADNLSGVGVMRGYNLEQFGFLVLLTAMGWVVAQRAIASQQKLATVEKELEIARSIQQSILPDKVPDARGLEIAVRYVPMTAVAGDFYDFHLLEDGRVGVLVADVSGHGVPAALIASMLKMAFVSNAAVASDPAQLLTKLNNALCGHFSSHFVTAIYAVFDPNEGTLTYSGAAHPPVLVCRHDGRVDELSENGLMLGAFEFAQYANASSALGAGDQVLLFTDGLAEGSNGSDEEFGIERLKAAFDSGATKSLENVFAKAGAWTAKVPQQDDLTAVVVACKGKTFGHGSSG